MKKFYSIPGLFIALVFVIFSAFLIGKSAESAVLYKEEKSKVAEILNFNDRLLSFRDWIFTKEAWLEKKAEFEVVLNEADQHYNDAIQYGHYLLFSCLVFLLIVVVIYARKRPFFGITLGLSFVALVLLAEGITNPMLEISVFKEDLTIKVYLKPKDIPYFEDAVEYMSKIDEVADYVRLVPFVGDDWADGAQDLVTEGQTFLKENQDNEFGMDKVFDGRTYFYYQNKGILDVILLLWNNSNKMVACAIGVFSVIIPCIKLLFTLLLLILPATRVDRLRKVLNYIAKWSMADVFVVAAFLAYLSFANMSPGVEIDAQTLFGLYYFGGYVVISIVLGMLLDRSIKEKMNIWDETALTDQPILLKHDENEEND